MVGKSLMAAPLWAERRRNQPGYFHPSPHNRKKTQILHHQDFDDHMSDDSTLHMHFVG
jgi:hypothetical protein